MLALTFSSPAAQYRQDMFSSEYVNLYLPLRKKPGHTSFFVTGVLIGLLVSCLSFS